MSHAGPDGARLAYIGGVPHHVMVGLDGDVGNPYQEIRWLTFSDGGAHLTYVGVSEGIRVPVVDGVEGTPRPGLEAVAVSPDGRRVVYVVKEEEGLVQVVDDGEPGREYAAIWPGSITFSPDGKRMGDEAQEVGAPAIARVPMSEPGRPEDAIETPSSSGSTSLSPDR